MSRYGLPLLATGLTVALVAVGWGVGRWRGAEPGRAPAASGALLFQVHCASCHGADGHGDGGASIQLRPAPRDFACRPWRFEPTPESIRRVTLDGIQDSAMPSFRSSLSAPEIDALVAHVQQLATRSPAADPASSDDERLLKDAGFADLRGAVPPSLTLAAPDGKTVDLAGLRGKLTLVHFWGTGCIHCVKEIPHLHALEKAHAGRLACLHVCTDEDDPDAAQKALDRHATGVVALCEPTGLGLARFEIQALPTVWLIGPDGKSIGRASGARDWTTPALIKLVDRWLPPANNK